MVVHLSNFISFIRVYTQKHNDGRKYILSMTNKVCLFLRYKIPTVNSTRSLIPSEVS